MTFRPGNHPAHDVAAAGRKGKANSPWQRHRVIDAKTSRLHRIRRTRERLFGLPAATGQRRPR